ncbi:hypothetical protein ACJ5H2_16150 [Nocardioides sp. R1-1]|uniref:hypothetical protein n=1 Tax=Nocardioides sp. R1-1 TaxID=3383502 RepID=UPI0038D096CC
MTRGWVWWSRREGALLALLCLAAGIVFMVSGGLPWLGSWKMALDWSSGSAILVGPVVAGLAAWRYSKITAVGLDVLAAQSVRGARAWLAPAAALWSLACAVVLLVALVTTSLTLTHGSVTAPRQAVILVLAGSALAAQVLLGAFVGTRFPGPWAPPVSAALVFSLGMFSSVGAIPETFRTGGVTSSLVGQGYVGRTLLAQAAVALALAAILLYAVRARIAPTASRALGAVTAIAVLVGAACWVGGPATGERYRFVPAPLVCDDRGRPEVCMARETRRPLHAVAEALRAAAAPLRDARVDLPERWVQDVPGRRHPAGAGVLRFVDIGETRARADRDAVLWSLGAPADCAAFRGYDAPPAALQAQSLLVRWLGLAADPGRSDGGDVDTWLLSAEGETWAARTYAGLASCSLDELQVPPVADRGW